MANAATARRLEQDVARARRAADAATQRREQAEGKLAEVLAEIAEADEWYRRRRATLTATRAALDARATAARRDERELRRRQRDAELVAEGKTPRRSRPTEKLASNPHAQAGEKNVEMMRKAFRRLGQGSAAAATRLAGSPAGHQVWAIRALEKEGFIRDTGRTEGRSRVYEVVGAKKQQQRRRTRVRPGQSRAA